jgi:peptidoglycan/xylan/chitin deacetylase (PgdA/CDA1 family)
VAGVKSLVVALLYASGFSTLWRVLRQRRRVTVLCFHDPDPLDFARHVQALRRHYQLISLAEFVRWRADSRALLPAYPMVITLDDGHAGNFRLLDVIDQHQVPVTIFLCSGIFGTFGHFWWKEVPYEAERWRLKSLPDDQRLKELEQRWAYQPLKAYEQPQALSELQVQAMNGRWVEFQAHTRLHPILPRCSLQKARDEIAGCRADLERSLKRKVYAFAYPNGDYSDRDVALVREAGYSCALTIDAGSNDRQTDAYRLKRILIEDDLGDTELMVRASGLWDACKQWLGSRSRFGYQTTVQA